MTFYRAHVAGIYGEVHNLGSLVVRLVFWPVESTAFRIFSSSDAGGTQAKNASERPLHAPVALLQNVHKFVVLVALIAFTFGPSYSFTAIHILLSSRWSSTEAPALLALYSGSLSLLASNGILEAYSHARMSNLQLARANAWLLVVTLAQAAAMWVAHAVAEDAKILLAIDASAMLARIVYALCIIHSQAGGLGNVWLWLPSPGSLSALGLIHLITRSSLNAMMAVLPQAGTTERLPAAMLHHIAVGAAALGMLLLVLLSTEKQLIHSVRLAMKPHID
jgi:Rft protein